MKAGEHSEEMLTGRVPVCNTGTLLASGLAPPNSMRR